MTDTYIEAEVQEVPVSRPTLWDRMTVGPTALIRGGFVCLVLGILFWGLAIAGGIMLSTGVVLRTLVKGDKDHL